jgi:hypothetical protein
MSGNPRGFDRAAKANDALVPSSPSPANQLLFLGNITPRLPAFCAKGNETDIAILCLKRPTSLVPPFLVKRSAIEADSRGVLQVMGSLEIEGHFIPRWAVIRPNDLLNGRRRERGLA